MRADNAPRPQADTVPDALHDAAELDALLAGSSRTFALSIPLLPSPLRRQVTVAYLLFRLADTFEDEPAWTVQEKLAGLDIVREQLAGDDASAGLDEIEAMLDGVELTDPGYTRLVRRARLVLEAYASFPPAVRTVIAEHLGKTIDGMSAELRRPTAVSSVDDVRRYCYIVAGLVGEMLTELFILEHPPLGEDPELRDLAPRFGEALQLVNILRDSAADAREGRFYVPSDEDRPALFELAEDDLALAARYVERLERGGAAPGVVAFNALNLRLAVSTIALVRRSGPGAKITRDEVHGIFNSIVETVRDGGRLAALLDDVPAR